MAGEHTYTFILKNETGGDGVESPISGNLNSPTTSNAKTGGFLSKSQAKAFGAGMVVYHQVKSFATQIVSHEISITSLKTGQNELQQRAQFNYDVGMRVLNAGESILVGAAVGGLPGAVAGLALSLTHTVIDISQRQQDLDLKRSLEQIQVRENVIRAGGGRRNV